MKTETKFMTAMLVGTFGLAAYGIFSKPYNKLNPNNNVVAAEKPISKLEETANTEVKRFPVQETLPTTNSYTESQPITQPSLPEIPSVLSRLRNSNLESLAGDVNGLYSALKDLLALSPGSIPRTLTEVAKYSDGSSLEMFGPLEDQGVQFSYQIALRSPNGAREQVYIHAEKDADGNKKPRTIEISSTQEEGNIRSGKKISIDERGINIFDVMYVHQKDNPNGLPQTFVTPKGTVKFGQLSWLDFCELASYKTGN